MSKSTGSFSAGGDVYGFDGYYPTESVKDSVDDSVLPDGSNGPNLSPATEMSSEEGFALREWRRLNAIRLAEKEMEEKELLKEIIAEADKFKREFYSKREITVEKRKASNRDKEKQFLASQESFHAEAGENYWKAIAELIPREVPAVEKKGKKEKDKKPSITVLHGPKPGKPTDMARMRQILVKLKHDVPDHMKPKPPQPKEETAKDGNGKGGPAKAGTNGTSGAVGSP